MEHAGRLQGKTALVTGANQGIGRAIALAFAAEGAHLFLCDVNAEKLPEIAEATRRHGAEAHWETADVTRPDDVERAMGEAEQKLGRIDILVNNAGIFQSERFLAYKLGDWNRMLEVNVTGTFLCAQAALRRMVPAGGGKIVNMASIAGKSGAKFMAAYNTSKHAVIGLTRCLALEMAEHGINVNAICPGLVDTDMFDRLLVTVSGIYGMDDPEILRRAMLKRVPMGKMNQPEEIAQLAVYLASPESDGMTGQALTLSGGMVLG
jgi:3-hydroxybutyrate dehydrogenase